MDENIAEEQAIRNNQRIFGKVIAATYAVVCCILVIANCGRNIEQVHTDFSLTDDMQMY